MKKVLSWILSVFVLTSVASFSLAEESLVYPIGEYKYSDCFTEDENSETIMSLASMLYNGSSWMFDGSPNVEIQTAGQRIRIKMSTTDETGELGTKFSVTDSNGDDTGYCIWLGEDIITVQWYQGMIGDDVKIDCDFYFELIKNQ